jgi:RNA polymerase sigma factor (sigma-70 family)
VSITRRSLTRAEELALFERLRSGDSSARDELFWANQGLVFITANRFASATGAWHDEAISYGQIGLLQAIDRFDHTRGFRFNTFARWTIRRNVFDGWRESGATIRRMSRQAFDLETIENRKTPAESKQAEDIELVSLMLESLDDRQRNILTCRIMNDMGYKEIGKISGLNSVAMHRMVFRSLAKLRRLFTDASNKF